MIIGGRLTRSEGLSSKVSIPSSTVSSSTLSTTIFTPNSAPTNITVSSSRFWLILAMMPSFINAIMISETDLSICSDSPLTVIGTFITFVPGVKASKSIVLSGSTCFSAFFLDFFGVGFSMERVCQSSAFLKSLLPAFSLSTFPRGFLSFSFFPTGSSSIIEVFFCLVCLSATLSLFGGTMSSLGTATFAVSAFSAFAATFFSALAPAVCFAVFSLAGFAVTSFAAFSFAVFSLAAFSFAAFSSASFAAFSLAAFSASISAAFFFITTPLGTAGFSSVLGASSCTGSFTVSFLGAAFSSLTGSAILASVSVFAGSSFSLMSCTEADFGSGTPTGAWTDADFGKGTPTGAWTDADFGKGTPVGGCIAADALACIASLAESIVLCAALASAFAFCSAFSRNTFAATVAGFTATLTSLLFGSVVLFGGAFTIFVSVVFVLLCRIMLVIAFTSISDMTLLWLFASIPIALIFSSNSLESISNSLAISYTFFDINTPHSSFLPFRSY